MILNNCRSQNREEIPLASNSGAHSNPPCDDRMYVVVEPQSKPERGDVNCDEFNNPRCKHGDSVAERGSHGESHCQPAQLYGYYTQHLRTLFVSARDNDGPAGGNCDVAKRCGGAPPDRLEHRSV